MGSMLFRNPRVSKSRRSLGLSVYYLFFLVCVLFGMPFSTSLFIFNDFSHIVWWLRRQYSWILHNCASVHKNSAYKVITISQVGYYKHLFLLQLRFLMRLQKPSLQILLLFRLGKFSFTHLSVGAIIPKLPILTGNLIHYNLSFLYYPDKTSET